MPAGSPTDSDRHAARARAAVIAGCLALSLAAAACSAGGGHSTPTSSPTRGRAAADGPAAPPATPTAPRALQITPAPYQLPGGLAREVALPSGRGLLIAGGLTAHSATTSAVTLLNPVTGQTRRAGRLAVPAHDAAGALLGGRAYVFGGGSSASIPTVQALAGGRTASTAGPLPQARSDLAAVTLGRFAYLVGGYNGAGYDASVLATADGSHFRAVARLAAPVRYPAVAAVGGRIYAFGGETPAGLTSDIQEVNPATGRARVVGHLPAPAAAAVAFVLGGTVYLAGGQVSGLPSQGGGTVSGAVYSFDPARATVRRAGSLPVPVANAAAAVAGGAAYVVGGSDGQRQVPSVTVIRLAPAPASAPAAQALGSPGGAASGSLIQAFAAPPGPGALVPPGAPWLRPARGTGRLAPGSDPSALPGDILIADNWNNRLLIVDPQGRIRWRFPRRGDLKRGQSFLLPDDAFFSPNGRYIVATEEEDSVISVISIATHKIVYRYGTPGVPGAADNHVANPDDAMMMPNGNLISADIKNCRLLLLRPPWRHPRRVIGRTDVCAHNPPALFSSPNGAFPSTVGGRYLVTEINGDWATSMNLKGHVFWSTHPPGVAYPSDTNEVYPGRYLTADYSSPGQVVEFNSRGRLLWRFGGLNHPSLAQPLPNGDILVNDDYNDRVIVIDPATHRIVWQYGHTGVPGTAPGYLNDPDGIDLTPPNSMLITHAATMGLP